jgi:superoxide reductase
MKHLTRRDFIGTGAILTVGAANLFAAGPAFAGGKWSPPGDMYQTLKDRKVISELEMKHVPLIQVPEKIKKGELFKLEVHIGRVLHPMMGPHHIEWIHVLKNGVPLVTTTLSYEGLRPVIGTELAIAEPSEIEVRIHCNVHGYWKETKTLELS